jgi:hypothetical protein
MSDSGFEAVVKRFCGSSVVGIVETERANEVASFALFEILAVKKVGI